MEEILAMFKAILSEELPKINTFTNSPAVASPPIAAPAASEVVADTTPVADTIQQSA